MNQVTIQKGKDPLGALRTKPQVSDQFVINKALHSQPAVINFNTVGTTAPTQFTPPPQQQQQQQQQQQYPQTQPILQNEDKFTYEPSSSAPLIPSKSAQKQAHSIGIFSNYQPVAFQYAPAYASRPAATDSAPSSSQNLNDSFEQVQEKDFSEQRKAAAKQLERDAESRQQELRTAGVPREFIIRYEDLKAISDTSLVVGQYQIEGQLILTNYKLIFVAKQEERFLRFFQRKEYSLIPLGFILKTERSIEKKGLQYSYIDITCKDGRSYRFKYAPDLQNQSFDMQIKIYTFAFPEDVRKTFAFLNADKELEEMNCGWNTYDIYKEFNRQALPIMSASSDSQNVTHEKLTPFRFLDNSTGNICTTYPPLLVVPSKMSNEDIIKCSKFRSRERLPVLTYGFRRRNSPNFTTLWRCAQCKPGVSQNRSQEDEQMLRMIGSLELTSDVVKTVKIYDARPYLNAVGQQITGKGYEMRQFYKNCEIEFLNIHNIHKVRDSYKKLAAASMTAQSTDYLKDVEKSEWLLHLSSIIEGTRQVVDSLLNETNVVIHCSDGWDRTAQLIALAQICIDPYFRTIQGFQVLIEKDWVSFGHMFGNRCGHASKNNSDDQRAPIFLQFLDSVFQLAEQFPLSFEFNSKYLAEIALHLHSNRFGTFLYNSYQEQSHYSVFDQTTSLWSYMATQKTQFENPFYVSVEESNVPVIRPDGHVRRLSVWKDHFMFFQPASVDPYRMYNECAFAEDNKSVLKRITTQRYEQFKEENKRLNSKIEELERRLKQCKQENSVLSQDISVISEQQSSQSQLSSRLSMNPMMAAGNPRTNYTSSSQQSSNASNILNNAVVLEETKNDNDPSPSQDDQSEFNIDISDMQDESDQQQQQQQSCDQTNEEQAQQNNSVLNEAWIQDESTIQDNRVLSNEALPSQENQ